MDQNIETTISVYIKLPEDMSEKIMEVKQELNVYYPDHEESQPHVTLYASPLAEDKYPELVAELRRMEFDPFTAALDPLKFVEHGTRDEIFVSFRFHEKRMLQSLHEQVVGIANPLRNGLIRYKDMVRRKEGRITEEQWETTQKYGFQYFMEHYDPHITIGTIGKDDAEKERLLREKLHELEGREFSIDTIYVKQSKRSLPEYKKIFESESIPIRLGR